MNSPRKMLVSWSRTGKLPNTKPCSACLRASACVLYVCVKCVMYVCGDDVIVCAHCIIVNVGHNHV